MSEPVILPSGAELVIRDPESVRHRDRRAYLAEYEAALDGITDPVDRGYRALAIFTAFAIEKTTLNMPMRSDGLDPKTLASAVADALDELTPADYDALQQAIKPVDTAMFPNFSPTPEPDSPTVP